MTKQSDEAFMRWCASTKPCRYCGGLFTGPVCHCEQPSSVTDATAAPLPKPKR